MLVVTSPLVLQRDAETRIPACVSALACDFRDSNEIAVELRQLLPRTERVELAGELSRLRLVQLTVCTERRQQRQSLLLGSLDDARQHRIGNEMLTVDR